MTDEQRQRIWEIENSCDGRTELAERIVGLEDKLVVYENDHQIATHIHGSWKRLKAEVPKLREENEKLRELVHILWQVVNHNAKGREGMISHFDLLAKATRLFEELRIEVV